jgi:hypothetical protein
VIRPQYQFGIGTGFGVKDVVSIIRLVVTNSCTRVDFYNYFHVHDKLAKFEFILFKILTNIYQYKNACTLCLCYKKKLNNEKRKKKKGGVTRQKYAVSAMS